MVESAGTGHSHRHRRTPALELGTARCHPSSRL